ncbi:MAG: hypothetical protein IKW08_00820 [Roseburia sp.]|nr:hypothetical protein [Roseburia sp.]
MGELISSQKIIENMKGKVLGGAKVPHSCSFPVIRKVNEEFKLAFFVQLVNKEQVKNNLIQRPVYWCYVDLETGENFVQNNCKELEFCSAPYDRLYKKGISEQIAQKEDVASLYLQLDKIREHYVNDGIFDAFAYKNYLTDLFKLLPSGQINFYKELSKLV